MAYRDRYNLEPLQVRAWLRAPVVADKWLPLDGVLLYQAHRDQCGAQHATVPGDYSGQMKIATLPLGIISPGRRNWYYKCSWAQWSHDIEGRDHWNKRFDSAFTDLLDMGRRSKVQISEGPYKAYHMPIFYRAALWVEWYCVGDKSEIKRLLSTLTHLGKKGTQGWGRVSRWEVSRWPHDWSIVREGRLMRGIPEDQAQVLGISYDKAHYGIRPSYWKSSNQKMLAVPE